MQQCADVSDLRTKPHQAKLILNAGDQKGACNGNPLPARTAMSAAKGTPTTSANNALCKFL